LAGCAGSQPPIGAPSAVELLGKKHSKTFSYTGAKQMFTVPKGVTAVTVTASGASGAPNGSSPNLSGAGGLVVATIPVTPEEPLAIFVGGEGTGNSGGYNGGGNGAGGGLAGLAGGGASDVRQGRDRLNNRVVVAGGGGGQGGPTTRATNSVKYPGGAGGSAGGRKGAHGLPLTQVDSTAAGGGGGTQRDGGSGGAAGGGSGGETCFGNNGTNGSLGEGGFGGNACFSYEGGAGGGGGGGYYGGGGGGGAGGWVSTGYAFSGGAGGGGGGSSYVEKSATHVTDKAGAAAPGNGQVIISW
jgi:hypothetical protein